MIRSLALVTLLAASVSAFVVPSPFRTSSTAARRVAASPQANLFESLGKIADYNKKYFGTMIAGMMDSRTAQASHVLFSFSKYADNAQSEAEAVKAKIAAGELSFADAAAQYSTCPSSARGGDLGEFKRGAMVPEFDGCRRERGSGGLEGPIKTQFGAHAGDPRILQEHPTRCSLDSLTKCPSHSISRRRLPPDSGRQALEAQ